MQEQTKKPAKDSGKPQGSKEKFLAIRIAMQQDLAYNYRYLHYF